MLLRLDNPFWRLEWGRVEEKELQRRVWGWSLAGVALACLLAWGLGFYTLSGFGWIWAFLSIILAVHSLCRGFLQASLPAPTFAHDCRTGNLDQLRLLPLNSHILLLARWMPAGFYRLLAMSLWLPVYAWWGILSGFSAVEALILWGLVSFGDYRVLLVLSLYLLLPWEGMQLLCLIFLLFGYVWVRESAQGVASGHRLMGGWVGVALGLCVLSRLIQPIRFATIFPDLTWIALILFWIELLRFDRIARWLNAPTGLWRFFFVIPLGALLFMVQEVAWAFFDGKIWKPGEQAMASLTVLFVLVGWFGLWHTTLDRAGRSVEEPFHQHLSDAILHRGTGLVVAVLGSLRHGIGLTDLKGTFAALYLLLVVMDCFGMALARHWLQALYYSRRRAPGFWLFGFLTVLPWLFLPFNRVNILAVLSPMLALSSFSPLWNEIQSLMPGTATSTGTIPLIEVFVLPILHYGLLYVLQGVWSIAARGEGKPLPRWLRWLRSDLSGFSWMERVFLRQAQNPVFCHMVRAGPRSSPWFVYGLSVPLGFFGKGIYLSGPVWVILWYISYQRVQHYLRRLIETGEFKQWLTTPLSNKEIYWGLVRGGWWWQLRWWLFVTLAMILGYVLRTVSSWTLMASSGATTFYIWGGLLLLPYGLSGFFLLSALAGCCLLIAVPIAVHDMLTPVSLRSSGTGAGHFRALVNSVLWSLPAWLCCCWFLTPLSLLGLPIYSPRTLTNLDALRRAPEDFLGRR